MSTALAQAQTRVWGHSGPASMLMVCHYPHPCDHPVVVSPACVYTFLYGRPIRFKVFSLAPAHSRPRPTIHQAMPSSGRPSTAGDRDSTPPFTAALACAGDGVAKQAHHCRALAATEPTAAAGNVVGRNAALAVGGAGQGDEAGLPCRQVGKGQGQLDCTGARLGSPAGVHADQGSTGTRSAQGCGWGTTPLHCLPPTSTQPLTHP